MRVVMRVEVYEASSGLTYRAGETYELAEETAEAFVAAGVAVPA